MNGYVIIAGLGLVAFVGFVIYNLRIGFDANLVNAKQGEVYRFQYLQPVTGKAERYMVKFLDSYTLTGDQINKLNARSRYRRNDPNFMRTAHLVTGQCSDGTIRNFYAERTIDCKRTLIPKVLNRVGVL